MQQQSNGRTVIVDGRIVWGVGSDLFKGRIKTDMQTRQPIPDKTTGQPVVEYGFGLAVPKASLQLTAPQQPGEVWAAMHEEAYTLFPTRQIPPSFAMKYKDGDSVDDKGVLFSQREGYGGHIVLALTTRIPIKWFKFEPGVGNVLVNEGIKIGDYVRVQLMVKAHGAVGQGKAGLYLNPLMVQFLGYGKEIINTPSGDAVFGNAAPPLPPGAMAMPMAPQGAMFPPAAPTFQGAPAAPAYQQPPAAQPQPHYGVVPPQHQPPQQPGNVGYAGQGIPATGPIPGPTAPTTAYPSDQQQPAMPAMPPYQQR